MFKLCKGLLPFVNISRKWICIILPTRLTQPYLYYSKNSDEFKSTAPRANSTYGTYWVLINPLDIHHRKYIFGNLLISILIYLHFVNSSWKDTIIIFQNEKIDPKSIY